MIENFTLHDAVSKAFDVKNVPQFNEMRPVRQAQEWLKEKGINTRYDKHQKRAGVVVYQRGGGVLFAVVNDTETDDLGKNAVVLGSLSIVETEDKPAKSSKSAKKTHKTDDSEEMSE